MKPGSHLIISSIAATGLTLGSQSWLAGVSCLAGGVLIDLDHVIDYKIEKKRIPLDYRQLSDFCQYDKKGKLYLIFHGVEYCVAMFVMLLLYPHPVLLGFLCGVSLHLMCDHLFNPLRPGAYFMLFRWRKNFERRFIFKQDYVQKILQIS